MSDAHDRSSSARLGPRPPSDRFGAGPPDRARLFLEGIGTSVVARVARRRARGMVCVQDLPFLRLESTVIDDSGRRGRIVRVALDVERDVPKLVIELVYEPHDDETHSGPSAPVVAEPSGVHRATEDRADAARPSFRADPIDALREPPIAFAELVRTSWERVVGGLRWLSSRRSALVG